MLVRGRVAPRSRATSGCRGSGSAVSANAAATRSRGGRGIGNCYPTDYNLCRLVVVVVVAGAAFARCLAAVAAETVAAVCARAGFCS